MSEKLLENRDYTIIVARGYSSNSTAIPGITRAWEAAATAIMHLAKVCETLDPEGITVYFATQPIQQYQNIFASQLEQILPTQISQSSPHLLEALNTALDDYFVRKAVGQTKPNGEIILVVLDSEPSDRMAINKALVNATQKMDHNDELGISFIQVGDDLIARGFLSALDNDLKAAGAKLDIVDTKTLAEVEENSLTKLLLDAIYD